MGILLLCAALVGDLESGFLNPPDSAKPHTWYHMMNGNVTKAGITRDFEALAEAGFGGVQMFDAGCDIPPGGLDFNSPAWFDMFRHAASEARRLGLEICIPNCSGWSSSGGPWIAPSNGMKRIVFTETRVKGPVHFHGELPRTKKDNGYYADIATVAFPLPKAEWDDGSRRDAEMQRCGDVKVGGERLKGEGWKLADGKNDPVVKMKRGDGEKNVIQVDYPRGIPAVGLDLQIIGGDSWAEVFTLEVEANGESVISRSIALAQSGARDPSIQFVPFPRLLTVKSLKARFKFGKTGRLHEFTVGELRPVARRRIADWGPKTFAFRRPVPEDRVPTPHDCLVRKEDVRDVSAAMASDGTLDWDVPAGEWVVLRVGSVCNGRCNHPASDHGRGLEVDKLDAAAMDFHIEQYVARLCRELGDLAGNVKSGFNNILVDSFEVGSQNWTQKFEAEFVRRKGYSLRPYLPVFAGRIVGGTEETDRFLEDFRRTVADLFAENYAGALAKKCHQYGLLCSIEPYGNCPADNLQYGQYADIPMGEFWSHASNPYRADAGNAKFVSYVAHVWGRPYCATESFTANPRNGGRWMTTPFLIKAQGDSAFADGVNRLIYHRFTHQPWADDRYLPGMTMGRWGMHLDRTQTWWPYAKPFFRYQARCQYLLQRGTFVADVLYFAGEQAPNQGGNVDGGATGGADMRLPDGYDKDICPTDAMYALRVENGEVVVPGGVRYRVLAIPELESMTPKMAKRIGDLCRAGAVVSWPRRPSRALGLAAGPNGDAEVRRLVDEAVAAGARTTTPAETLAALGVEPQVKVEGERVKGERVKGKGERVKWIHRRELSTGEAAAKQSLESCAPETFAACPTPPCADWFFVALPNRDPCELDLSFRVSGREPELWDAESGEIKSAPVWRAEKGRTIVRVPFNVCGSKFVVFRRPTKEMEGERVKGERVKGERVKGREEAVAEIELEGPWEVSFPQGFVPNALAKGEDEKVVFNELCSWSERPEKDVRYFSGSATYRKKVKAERVKGLEVEGGRVILDLGTVHEVAQVTVNGKTFEPMWRPPFRLDITEALHPFTLSPVHPFTLEIRVANLWANRLIGDDREYAPDCEWKGVIRHGVKEIGIKEIPQWVKEGKPSPTGRHTFTTWKHWDKNDELQPSGLIGPVKLLVVGGEK